MTDLEQQAATLRARLVDELTAAGAIRDPAWRQTFLTVPRHRFVPAFLLRTPEGHHRVDATSDPQRWLEGVYRNASLTVAQVDGVATSSSTEPALMATMLDALDLHNGHHVLEIGTGTGYNAALLSERLSDKHVTSVEVDPSHASSARATLASLGYHPAVIAGDGLAGYPTNAPYDRIIATCSTTHLPPTWQNQTRPGGIILANLGYGLAKLHRHHDGSASGQFLTTTAAFIDARPAGTPAPLPVPESIALATSHDGVQRPVSAPPVLDSNSFWFTAKLLLPTVAHLTLHNDEDPDRQQHLLVDPITRSWARADLTGQAGTLHQGGRRRLWEELERAAECWQQAGRPHHSHLGITIDRDGHHHLWATDPSQPLAAWNPTHHTSTKQPRD